MDVSSSLIKEDVRAYHDESGVNGDRYVCHGVLLIRERFRQAFINELTTARDGYKGEVHYTELNDYINPNKAMATVASRWLQLYFQRLHRYCTFSCVIVDTEDGLLGRIEGLEQAHLYAFGMADAIRYGVDNIAKGLDGIALSLYSDIPAKGPSILVGVPDLVVKSDTLSLDTRLNIPNHVLVQLILARNKPGIVGRLDSLGQSNGFLGSSKGNITLSTSEVVIVNTNPARAKDEEERNHSELVQLTDLLTGLVLAAVNESVAATGLATTEIKVKLRGIMGDWMQDPSFRVNFLVEFMPEYGMDGRLSKYTWDSFFSGTIYRGPLRLVVNVSYLCQVGFTISQLALGRAAARPY